jgi:hypothetical protein
MSAISSGNGLGQILRDCGLSTVTCRLACVMTLNRLIAPASEHAMPAWIRRTALADILGISFDALGAELQRSQLPFLAFTAQKSGVDAVGIATSEPKKNGFSAQTASGQKPMRRR